MGRAFNTAQKGLEASPILAGARVVHEAWAVWMQKDAASGVSPWLIGVELMRYWYSAARQTRAIMLELL